MESKQNKTFFLIFGLTVFFLISFFGVKEEVFAANHGLTVKAINCPVEDYAGDTGKNLYDDCAYDYADGYLDSYVLAEGENVEPGSLLMLAVEYDYKSVSEIITFNTTLSYNTELLTAVSEKYVFLDNSYLPKDPSSKRPKPLWNLKGSYPSEGKLTLYGDETTYVAPLNEETTILGAFFVYVNDDPGAAGQSLSFILDKDASNVSARINGTNTRRDFDVTNLNLSIAGDVVSTDSTLKSLEVKNGSTNYNLTPDLVPGSADPKEFTVYVPYTTTSVNVIPTVHDPKAKGYSIFGDCYDNANGVANLAVGDNEVTVRIDSAAGPYTEYVVTIHRLNNVATLSAVHTNEKTITTTANQYHYEIRDIPFATTSTNVSADLTDANASIPSGTGSWEFTNSGATPNQRTITVYAENCHYTSEQVPGNVCTSQDYTIDLYRNEASNNNYLSSLNVRDYTFQEGAFDKTSNTYTLPNVLNDITSISFTAVREDDKSVITVNGNPYTSGTEVTISSLNVGDNTIDIAVQSESGAVNHYYIKVRRLSNDATLALNGLTVTSTPQGTISEFDPNYTTYTYSYDPTVTSVSVSATANSNLSKVSIVDASGEYTLAKGDSNTASASFATTTTKVIVYVVAEDEKTTKSYTIDLARGKSSNYYLSGISVHDATEGSAKEAFSLNEAFVKTTYNYTLTVSANVDVINVLATPEDVSYAEVTKGNGDHYLNFGSNQIEVSVTAENGNDKSYYINVTREEYADATLSELKVDGVSVPGFTSNVFDYTITEVIPYTTLSVDVQAKTNNTYAEIMSGTGSQTLKTGANDLSVVVQAQNGHQETYHIHILREYSNDTSVKEVVVHGESATKDNDGNWYVTLSNSITEITEDDIYIGPYDNNASVTKTTGTLVLSTTNTNTYRFSVEAENCSHTEAEVPGTVCTSKPSTVTVIRKKSEKAEISSAVVTLPNGDTYDCNVENKTCKIGVPADTKDFTLSANISAGATITPANGSSYSFDEENPVTKSISLNVTSENEEVVVPYTIIVERILSDNNYLSAIQVTDLEGNVYGVDASDFHEATKDYIVHVPAHVTSVSVTATVKDTGKAGYATDIAQPLTNLTFGDSNRVMITVTAENGNTRNYNVYIDRALNDDATLQELSVDGTSIFEANKKDYTLDDVRYNAVALTIGAEATDINAKSITILNNTNQSSAVLNSTGNGTIHLSTGRNEITITVLAQDGETKENYTISVWRNKNESTAIQKIVVAGNEAVYNAESGYYEVTVANNITVANSNNVVVTVEDPKLPTDPLATYTVVSTNLATNKINYVTIHVTSESGNSKTPYTVAVTRQGLSTAVVTNLSVTDGTNPIGNWSKAFETATHDYTITLPSGTTEFNIVGETKDNASFTRGVGHFFLTTNPMTVPVVVLSEDGNATDTYNLTFQVELSKVNTLDRLSVSYNKDGENVAGTLSPSFNKDTTSYTVVVPDGVTDFNVTGAKASEAKDVTGFGDYTIDETGMKKVNVTVTSESGEDKVYTIVVKNESTDKKSSVATLKDLILNGTSILEEGKTHYTFDYENEKAEVSVSAIVNDTKASIQLNGGAYVSGTDTNLSLNVGTNTITFDVLAENGDPKSYVITINRAEKVVVEEKITSVEYGHTIDESYIRTVASKQTVLNVKDQLDNDNSKLKVYESDGTTELSDDTQVGTGKVVKLFVDGKEVDSKVIIVKGDVTGEGEVDMSDAGDIANHYMDRVYLTGVSLIAGDVNEDGIVDMSDAGDIANHYMDRVYIVFKK